MGSSSTCNIISIHLSYEWLGDVMADQVTAVQSLRVEALRIAVQLKLAERDSGVKIVDSAAYLEKYLVEGTTK